jgi:hypothetical protein
MLVEVYFFLLIQYKINGFSLPSMPEVSFDALVA